MRVVFLICLIFLSTDPALPQRRLTGGSRDTIELERFPGNSIGINYRMLPAAARYEKRYKILKNYNNDYGNIEINFSIQNFITGNGYGDSSMISGFSLVNSLYNRTSPHLPSEKEMFYGAWRAKLTGSSTESGIRSSMIEGTEAMIALGYTDLTNDFLPFIAGLMEENHIVNYDNSRTKAFGSGSKGIVTSVQILNAMGSQDSEQNFGVCRDVHETGRELLKSMAETWYGHFHPDIKTDFDNYIFLQSWTTNKSHHVTISFIDPLDTKRVYELDWGRVIERKNIPGYDNGRLYGNTYRIWQYDKKKQMSVPVDFRRTHFGKILDENILSRKEYLQFNGIYDEEFYSDVRYTKDLGKYGGMSLSLGTYNPGQHYFLAGWYLETGKKKITGFLDHSSLLALQGAIHEDTRKKQYLYPQTGWQFTGSIMGIPRIISKFETKAFRIAPGLSLEAYLNQQFDAFIVGNSFYTNDSIDSNELSGSGDGNLSFSNGVNLVFKPGNRFYSSLTLQARSCLLPKEIRLFSPNVSALIPNLRYITPAVDAMANAMLRLNERSSVSFDGMLEFTNLDAVICSGSLSSGFTLARDIDLVASLGCTEQIKGIDYFWYPSSGRWIKLNLNYDNNSLSFSLLQYHQSRMSCNITFVKTMR